MHDARKAAGERSAPERVGEYELITPLARGGMARVFLARRTGDVRGERLCALKLVHAHMARHPEMAPRFSDEARWASRVRHPSVVGVIDSGLLGSQQYTVMPYVEGCTLASMLAPPTCSRPTSVIVSILIDVLSGLHAAHTLCGDDGRPLEIVHRDVSPPNVLLGLDGRARITDFGIASSVDQSVRTRPGIFMGKMAFAAPEQLESGTRPDARVDVFAVGAMAWTALTGLHPFRAKTDYETSRRVRACQVPPPSQHGLHPPTWLDSIVLRALARDPERRFRSARAMALALASAARKHDAVPTREQVGEWVLQRCAPLVQKRRARVDAHLQRKATRRARFTTESGTRPASPD